MSAMPDDGEFPGFDAWWVDAWVIQCERCGDQEVCTGSDQTAAWVAAHVCDVG